MSRLTLVRRYGPLLAVAAVQLLIIATVPSTAQKAATDVGTEESANGPGTEGSGTGVIDPETGQVIDPVTGQVIDPATGRPVGSGTGASSGSSGGGGGGGGGIVGDTKHCVNGRQYDPAIYDFAPPCVPKFTGNNGGATHPRGVTGDSIKVIVMRGNYGQAVNAILENQGTATAQQFSDFIDAGEKFINDKYELYGRKIDLVFYQIKAITGGQSAPEDAKLREEMRQLVRDHNPFAVIWANSVSSATYDQLSKLKVVNLGGYGFTDDFNQARRPYHWDVQMGGYQLAERVSSWYCTRMHGGGTAKADYAGRPASGPYTQLANAPRHLGIISTNDPENKTTAQRVIDLMKSKCGVNVTRTYYYEQNIQTLQTQRQQAYENMTTGLNPATTIMCFCDQVAPAFLYYTCWDNDYFPEMVMVATGVMDLDRVAQEYDHGAEDKAARNNTDNDGNYPVFENAFGLAQFGKMVPRGSAPAAKVWQMTGKTGNPPYLAADEDWNYWAMLAGMIQMAGAKLTPLTLEAGAHKLGTLGSLTDQSVGQRSLGPGDYTWNDSLREVYWAAGTPSAFNGIKGSYTSLNGGRWFTGAQFPPGTLTLPAKPRP